MDFKYPYEQRHPYILVLHEDYKRTILKTGVMLVDQEVEALNKFFCKTGQLKRFYPDKNYKE